jgi:phage host-nuclease inhibitor protein Gam
LLLERFGELDGRIAQLEELRSCALGEINANMDRDIAPLLAERAALLGKLQPWWAEARAQLGMGSRKSIELGGCLVGSRAGRDSLAVCGDEMAIVAALLKLDWAQALLTIKVSLDKRAVMKALSGAHGKLLGKLGLGIAAGEEQFFVERVVQHGTLASAGAEVVA